MSKIEWTDETWNPVTGCTKVSQGCKHCYAETIAKRMWATQYPPNGDGTPRKFTDVRCHPDRLDQPLRWRKPRRVFVNSMSDLFHEDVSDKFIAKTWVRMVCAKQHTFQVLTKRPERMSALLSTDWRIQAGWPFMPAPNVWLGVSVENQAAADERIPLLLQTPAAVRFVSCEPLLGRLDLRPALLGPLTGEGPLNDSVIGLPTMDWVIVGGESGPGARPMRDEWAWEIVQHCKQADVPVFVKQLGGHPDKRGDIGLFPESLRIRQWPDSPSDGPGRAGINE